MQAHKTVIAIILNEKEQISMSHGKSKLKHKAINGPL